MFLDLELALARVAIGQGRVDDARAQLRALARQEYRQDLVDRAQALLDELETEVPSAN